MSGSPFGIGETYVGLKSADAAKDTANSLKKLSKTMRQIYEQNRADEMPMILMGQQGANSLRSLMSEGGRLYDTDRYNISAYEESDYNKWVKQQGIDALAASGAASGNYGSGNLGVALTQYGQNIAGSQYQQWYENQMNNDTTLYNRLMAMVSPGQTAMQTNASTGVAATNGQINATSLAGQNMQQAYANMLGALDSAFNGQIGNQITSGINAYNRNNAFQNQGWDNWGSGMGSDFGSMGGFESSGASWGGTVA